MSSVDERIVEMRFDNKEFEPGAKTTLSTLEKLKQALKFDSAGDGLSKLDSSVKGIDVSKLTAGVEALQNRFSTLGIVGMRVISNLTDSMMNLMSKGVSFLTSGILQGGYRRASNIEHAKFQIEGLGHEWSELEKQIDFAVKDTAYGLDSAAKAASVLLSSQIGFSEEFDATNGKLDQMGTALRAISGVAAQVDSDYDSIADVFETVAGNGKLMGDQVRRLSNRGMNLPGDIARWYNGIRDGSIAASEASKEAADKISKNTAVTEEQIRDLISSKKGGISFASFSQAMYDLYGEHAVKANETLNGSLSNVKAALARIGQAFYTPLIKQNGPLVDLFNTLRIRINEVKAAITGVGSPIERLSNLSITIVSRARDIIKGLNVEKVSSSLSKIVSVFENGLTIITNSIEALSNALRPIKRAFEAAFPKNILDVVVEASEKLAAFTEGFWKRREVSKKPIVDNGDLIPGDSIKTLYEYNDTFDRLGRIASGVFGVFRIGFGTVSALFNALKPVASYFKDLGGGFLEIAARVGDAISGFADFAEETDFFGTKIQNAIKFVKDLISKFEYITGIDLKLPTGEDLINFFENIVKKVGEFKDRATRFLDELWFKFKYIFGLEDVTITIDDIKRAFDNVVGSIKNFWNTLVGIKNYISGVFQQIHDQIKLLTGIDIHIPSINDLKFAFEKIKKYVTGITDFIKNNEGLQKFIGSIKEAFANFHVDLSGLDGFVKDVNSKLKPTEKILAIISNVITFILDLAGQAVPLIVNVAKSIGDLAKKLWGNIKELFTGGDFGSSLKNTTLAVVIYQIAQVLRQFNLFKDSFAIGNNFGKLINNIKGAVFEFSKSIKFNNFKKIATSILMLAVALKMLSGIDSERLALSMTAVTIMFAQLTHSIEAFSVLKIGKGFNGIGLALLELSASMFIMAGAAKMLASLDLIGLVKGIGGVSILLWELTAVAKKLSSDTGMMAGLSGLIAMAVSLRILTSSIKSLAKLDLTSLFAGFLVVSALLQEMTDIAQRLSVSGKNPAAIMEGLGGLIIMAASVKVLTSAMKGLAKLDLTSLLAGFLVVSALLQEMTAIAQRLAVSGENPAAIMKGLSGLLIMAISVKALASAMKGLSTLNPDALFTSFVAVSGLMTVMTAIAMKLQGLESGVGKAAGAFLVMSIAINAIAIAMAKLANIGDEGIFLSLIALGSAMTILATAMNAVKNSLNGAYGLGIIAAALIPLAVAMRLLGGMDIKGVVTSLTMLIATFAIMGVAAVVLNPFVDIILALSVAMLAFGAGATLCGVATIALAAGLTALGPAISIFVVGLMNALVVANQSIGQIGADLIRTIEKIISAFYSSIASHARSMTRAVTAIITSLCQAIVQSLPVIVSMGVIVIASFLEGIGRNIKRIIRAASELIINFLDGMSLMMPYVVSAGINLMVSFVNSMAEGIRTSGGDLIMAMRNLMSSLIEFALTALQSLVKDIPGIGGKAVSELEKAKQKVKEVLAPEEGKQLGYDYTHNIAEGMNEGSGEVEEAARHTGSGGSFALQDSLFGEEEGETSTQKLSKGMLNGEPDVLSATNKLGQGALSNLDIADEAGLAGALSIESYGSEFSSADLFGDGEVPPDSVLEGMGSKTSDFDEMGKDHRNAYYSGLESTGNEAQDSWNEIAHQTEQGVRRVYVKGVDEIDEGTDTMIDRHRKNASKIEKAAEDYIASPTMVGCTNVDLGKAANTNVDKYESTIKKGTVPKRVQVAAKFGLADPTVKGATDIAGSQGAANKDAGGFINTLSNSSNKSKANSGGHALAGAGIAGMRSQYNEAVSVGSYMGSGVSVGLNSKLRELRDTATHAIRTTILAMKNVAREQSPSKETMEIGAYMSEGLILGLLSLTSKLEKTGAKVGESSMTGINSVMSKVSDLINGNLEIDPTIRPVLDTSLIQNGLNSVDGLLASQRSMALAAGVSLNANNVGPTLEQKIGTAVDNALNKIYDKIEEASAKTPYQINVPLNIDKRQFARATATVTREELDRIDYFNNRKAGIA